MQEFTLKQDSAFGKLNTHSLLTRISGILPAVTFPMLICMYSVCCFVSPSVFLNGSKHSHIILSTVVI